MPRVNHARVEQLRIDAVRLRLAGAQFADIGTALGVSKTRAVQLVQEALKRTRVEEVEQMRATEGARLDALQRAVWVDALAGDVKAVNAALRISESRRRLFGLDLAPDVKIAVEYRDAFQARVDELVAGMAPVEVIHERLAVEP